MSWQWLTKNGFVSPEMILASNVRFVGKRADKGSVCRDLEITYFIDNRLDVLQNLSSVKRKYLLTAGIREKNKPSFVPHDILILHS